MLDRLLTDSALEVDAVETSPLAGEKFVIRLHGTCRKGRRPPDDSTVLVVELEGESHRFPAIPQPRRPRFGRAADWTAMFAIPSWLQERLDGNMTLMIGDSVVAVPSVSVQDAGESGSDEPPPEASDTAGQPVPLDGEGSEPERTEALHAELRARAAGEAHVRGELVDALAALKASDSNQQRLEVAQAQLRIQLEDMLELISHERKQRAEVESKAVMLAAQIAELQEQASELRRELAGATVSRDAALSEAEGLRAELERLGTELAAAREQAGLRGRSIGEAEALLEEARALTASMRGR